MTSRKTRLSVPGKDLVKTVKELIQRGDVRKVCLIHEEKHLLEIPLSAGDPASPATMLEAPVLAALNAVGALMTECTIEAEKIDNKGKVKPKS